MTIIDETVVAQLPAADVVQLELADIDERFHEMYGRDEAAWLPNQVAAYNTAIDSVWSAHPKGVAA
ncbi:hypothetical protein [Streptomyces sp. WAC05858]|uniref:hypothetical protein n=1 Tax=Streptomyces TaxID=1883 RepID=UPI000F7724EF|nr:hypothetical protein [Streptomyces sp. WAC05858]RSS39444.1 hypothetical protein EF902_27540 [Streptomyces sp. WAC05858]